MSDRISKKVSEYFQFVQDQLKQNYPGGKYKSPMQIKDKKERENFFSQVKELWKKKGESKQAAAEWYEGKVIDVKKAPYGKYDKEFVVNSPEGTFMGVLSAKGYDDDIKVKDEVKFRLYKNLYTALVEEIRSK